MHEEHDVELRLAVSKGFITPDEIEALRLESRRQSRSPLELLGERGLISEQTLARLRGAFERTATLNNPPGAATLQVDSARDNAPLQEAVFPVSGWERYQGGRLLGQGGMGQVFLAYDPLLRRNIALKFVKGDDAELVRRLLAEARAQARVKHERICQVYEVGEVQGRPYIAMQYVDGQSLSQLADTLTLEQKVLVLREAAEGVQAAHRAGLIHRDLKPSNILVERTEDGRLKPYVMDFGLARDWREMGHTAPGSVLGTPCYMSPEQARGEVSGLDRRADVYSLGATLYTLLVGQPPLSGANNLEVLNNIATREPRPPRQLKPDVPVDLEAIVLKCLEKDRAARYDSVRALIEELDRFLAGEPVRARPTSAWQRLRRKARKHRLLVGVASAALLVVALALGWAAFTRQQAAVRERLARGFTERVERMEALARYSGLSPLHDTRPDREQLHGLLAGLEAQILQAGDLAAGPGHHALGRGYLVLGEDERALRELEAAWREGFREPRVAASLALALGRLYQRELLEAARFADEARRKARERAAQERYRAPALEYLRLLPKTAPSGPAALELQPDYVQALIAFYEERF
ncbi:MAG TPA: serine/threonine-protein kinase, partial [Myxococcus sp.]|nr:serine/threonine-protein kinase [Myxococcus sp.]